MKYEVGDKIIVLHSDEEGIVIDIINDEMVMIEVRGVRFPAYMDQIDFPYFKMFSKPKPQPVKKVIYVDEVPRERGLSETKEDSGVYLGFLPVFEKDVFDDDVIEKLKVYIINQNNEDYSFLYNLIFSGMSQFQLNGLVAGHTQFYLHDVLFEDLNDNPRFEFSFNQNRPVKGKIDHLEKTVKIKAGKLFKKIEDVIENRQATFLYELFLAFPDKVSEERYDLKKLVDRGIAVYEDKNWISKLPAAKAVIDLHIDKLTSRSDKFSSAEMLELQKNTFEKYYNLAVAHNLKKLSVIHGIGNGKLVQIIHEALSARNEIKSFERQHHNPGITDIFFK
ncbi:MAG: Smr/MutS family protein [Ferruginibacter sp.]|nr:Smr/MutS family protein [Ferruginibacter sp.]